MGFVKVSLMQPSAAIKFLSILVLVIGLLIVSKPVSAATDPVMPSFDWSAFFKNFPGMSTSPSMPTSPMQTPSPTLRPTVAPTATPAPSSGSVDVQAYIMNGINSYRARYGLLAVKTDSNTCNFANTRAKEISTSFNHNGFTSRLNSRTLPYPSYRAVTENIAMNSNYRNVVNSWINSPTHAANMRADTPYVCVEKYGNYYAYEGWRP